MIDWLDLDSPNFKMSQDPIEVTIEEPKTDLKEKQTMVRFADVPKELLDLSPNSVKLKADHSSEKVQRVLEESKASLSGKTQNGLATQSSKPRKKINPMLNPHKLALRPFNDERVALNQQTNPSINEPLQLPSVPSTVGEVLSDQIKIGQFTALNTDRNMFYSFFTRIEDAVRSQWESGVYATLEMLQRSKLYINPRLYKTRIDILLTKDGHFFKAVLLKSSGINGLDQAIVTAFKEAQFFPNPPRELIGSDGFIKLEYLFQVDYVPPTITSQIHD